MKKFITLIVVLFAAVSMASAQHYKFYYISHSTQSDKSTIVDKLIKIFDVAQEEGWTAVFYLSNGDNPYIATTKDEKAFNKILSELQLRLDHRTDAMFDSKRLIELFDEYPFDGNKKYATVELNFYVNSDFWRDRGNETLLANFFEVFDIDSLCEQYGFQVNIHRSNGDEFDYDRERPFGDRYTGNMCQNFYFSGY